LSTHNTFTSLHFYTSFTVTHNSLFFFVTYTFENDVTMSIMICMKIAFGHSIFHRSFNISLSSWTITANSRSDTIRFSSFSAFTPNHFYILTPLLISFIPSNITSYLHSFLCLQEVSVATFLRKFISAASNLSQMKSQQFNLISYFQLMAYLNFQFPQGVSHQRLCYTFPVCPILTT